MASTIKVKAKVSGNVADVKSLMLNPTETGTPEDAETETVVPMNHITQLTFTNNDKLVMVANFSTAVSRDPYFSFKFSNARVGDTLKVVWVDNNGATDEIDSVLK